MHRWKPTILSRRLANRSSHCEGVRSTWEQGDHGQCVFLMALCGLLYGLLGTATTNLGQGSYAISMCAGETWAVGAGQHTFASEGSVEVAMRSGRFSELLLLILLGLLLAIVIAHLLSRC